MKKQIWMALAGVVLAIFVLAFAPVLWQMVQGPGVAATAERDLPWQVETLGEGRSRVFGLEPGRSTLADAVSRWGDALQLALLAAPGEGGQLEAFVDGATLGFVSGKLVLVADLPAAQAQEMQARASKTEVLASGARRYTLAAADQPLALSQRLSTISLLPSLSLDETTLLQRFGPPNERVLVQGQLHLLYPDKGLDITLGTEGKAARPLLQYVAPREFTRLTAPLRQNGGGQ
ncbi:hypothetical protein RQP53_07135 [Paucibacter sp. APW11]|uniref:Uncharacterized protein n=1 Tax=Roseateles aquae TaxID=3077235 RepID=A0ABU3PAA9_9BURK|nr:hypothetical protein [Paucibacter sp. APW11]MDT8999038.1 hypothetical protein [Paucibacter sp. APW11]